MDVAEQNKVSFIIPAKNEEQRLCRCLSSIYQLYLENTEIEIIVVDNGSIDNTVMVAEKLGAVVYRRPKDSVAGLRNFGASKASGNHFVFVDADIELDRNFLHHASKQFNHPCVGVVTGKILIPSDATWVEKTWVLNRRLHCKEQYINWSSSMNMMVRRDVFFYVGGFLASMQTCEDVEFSLRVRERGYFILYDYKAQVTHLGEAKTLLSFFLKERWRGLSSLLLIIEHPMNVRRWISFLQFPFFLLSFMVMFISIILISFKAFIVSLLCLVLLPLLRSILISIKNRSVKNFFNLLAVWMVYYIARSVALTEEVASMMIK